MIVDPDASFYIEDGVHRALAARELHLEAIPAELHRLGMRDVFIVVRLNRLYSPKETIHQWDRNRDFFDLVTLLQTPEGRAKMRPIFVQPLGIFGQSRSIPLFDVGIELGEGE